MRSRHPKIAWLRAASRLGHPGRTAAVLTAALAAGIPALTSATSGYNPVTLKALTVYQAGRGVPPGVLLELNTPFPTDAESCAHSNQGYAWIDWSTSGEPDGKAMYAAALAAHLAGKTLGIGFSGCSSQGYPLAYGINVN